MPYKREQIQRNQLCESLVYSIRNNAIKIIIINSVQQSYSCLYVEVKDKLQKIQNDCKFALDIKKFDRW